jgi:hypothetical protein
MGMKDKGGRAFGSGNDFMSAPHNPKINVAPAMFCKERKLTRRAGKCVSVKFTAGESMPEAVDNTAITRGNFLMGW